MARLTMRLLGGLEIAVPGGEAVAIPSRKARGLLAYLALSPASARSRGQLAALLWERSGEEQARASLRQELAAARRALGPAADLVVADADAVGLVVEEVEVDALAFYALVERRDLPSLRRAATLYRGELLAGFSLSAGQFEEWLTAERLRARETAVVCLRRLTALEAEAGRLNEAVVAVKRLVALDPLLEDAHRTLMELHMRQGSKADALRQYQALRDLLQKELRLEPEPATQQLYAEILRDEGRYVRPIVEAVKLTPVEAPPRPPNLPSVAVLPFRTIDDDNAARFLGDGIAEDLTALLARIPGIFVVAYSSAVAFRRRVADVGEIGRELGVRYVVEGSVQALEGTVRVGVRLSDAETGHHLWADRLTADAADLFGLQEQIVRAILARLEPELTRAELARVSRSQPRSTDVWTMFRRAHALLALKGWHEEVFDEATRLLEEVIRRDDGFALAHAYLALMHAVGRIVGIAGDPRAAAELALREAEAALALDNASSNVLGFAGCAISETGQVERGLGILELAAERDPSNAQAWAALGAGRLNAGALEDGLRDLRHGIRLSPLDSRLAVWGSLLAGGLIRAGRPDEAVEEARLAARRDPRFVWPRVALATALAALDRRDDACAALAEARYLRPALTDDQIDLLVPGGLEILRRGGCL